MKNVYKKVEKGLRYFCCALLGLSASMLVIIIFLRAVFGIGYDFLTDITVWLVIWSTMLYSGPHYGERGHVSIDFVIERLKDKWKAGVEFFNAFITLIYVGTVTIGGCIAIQAHISQHQVYARYVAIPMWIVQICIPIGFGLFTLYAIAELWGIARGAKTEENKNS